MVNKPNKSFGNSNIGDYSIPHTSETHSPKSYQTIAQHLQNKNFQHTEALSITGTIHGFRDLMIKYSNSLLHAGAQSQSLAYPWSALLP